MAAPTVRRRGTQPADALCQRTLCRALRRRRGGRRRIRRCRAAGGGAPRLAPHPRGHAGAGQPRRPRPGAALAQAALGLALPADDPALFTALYAATRELRAFAELERLLLAPRPLSAIVQEYGQLPGRARAWRRGKIEAEVTALSRCSAARRGGPTAASRRKRASSPNSTSSCAAWRRSTSVCTAGGC